MNKKLVGFFSAIALVALGITFAVAQQPKGPGFSGPIPEGQWYEKSVALVVGINSYAGGWPSLSAAANDADKVAAALSGHGFEVHTLKNSEATKNEIMRYLYNVIPEKLGKSDRFFFYFSGHGQTLNVPGGQVGYIVPADGKRFNGKDQWYTYISMRELKDVLVDHYKAKHIMVVADSCFSGLMTTKSTGVGASVSRALQYKGRMILTAGGKDEQAVDGVFAPVLVEAVNGEADTNGDGAVTFGEVSLYVRGFQIKATPCIRLVGREWRDGVLVSDGC